MSKRVIHSQFRTFSSCVTFNSSYIQVREDYQTKLNELAHYPEKLSSAEARYQHAEAQSEALQSQLAEKSHTVDELQRKIDAFQSQIGKLKEKVHAVNEDNIELSNKAQSHERLLLISS